MRLWTRTATATLAAVASLALPAASGADVLVQSDTGSGGGGALTVNGIDEGDPGNVVVFDWDTAHPDYFSFVSPDPDGPGPEAPPDQLLVDPPCALATGLSGEAEARCPAAGVRRIVGAMHSGDDSFTGSVTSGSQLLTGAVFPVPMLVLGRTAMTSCRQPVSSPMPAAAPATTR